jgi:undecaprenyl diphosphate synthase
MDGNGRWANNRLRPRVWGHVRGASVVSEIVEAADLAGVKALTLYAFSTENWSRPLDEVSLLFKLLKKFLVKEKVKILQNNISFRVIGEVKSLPLETIQLIEEIQVVTQSNSGLKLTFAFNYGSKTEIIRGVNNFIENNPGMRISETILDQLMYRPDAGDVDLLIRTGGEQRISNFLLWQIAYSELYFTPTKWPDFNRYEFLKILENVATRERRFGNVNSQNSLELVGNSRESFSRSAKFKN